MAVRVGDIKAEAAIVHQHNACTSSPDLIDSVDVA